MIEEKLVEMGISKEELEDFARLPKHNEKKDVFRIIVNIKRVEDLTQGSFYRILAEVLQEEGVQRWNFRKEAASQSVACEMLEMLNDPKRYKQHEYLTLERLYRDTIEQNLKV